MTSVEQLASVPLFSALSESQLSELARWFEARTASAGARLCGQGATGYTFFVLVDGTADVSSDGKPVATLGPGDFFGEIAILGQGRRTATVTATSPVSLLVMFGAEFRRLGTTHPDIASNIRLAMEDRLATRT
jgi:voltage-gated potassium channel